MTQFHFECSIHFLTAMCNIRNIDSSKHDKSCTEDQKETKQVFNQEDHKRHSLMQSRWSLVPFSILTEVETMYISTKIRNEKNQMSYDSHAMRNITDKCIIEYTYPTKVCIRNSALARYIEKRIFNNYSFTTIFKNTFQFFNGCIGLSSKLKETLLEQTQ
ncbi:hypothetical protein BpHYR1_047433 [Brachionus plicatilis]|uniref:Uncharacterized protein n=1 Tax=Brachionus plicatilis TaxID=10195 RepID=A0A3M7PDE8_BRAPC|nr:hypothetical protein BpHYR1_047433 [Brachionus plicatilis]